MAARDLIVVGASAGGVEALIQLARALPPGLPAALLVVCHFPPEGYSRLPEILSRSGPLLALHARDGEPVYPGQVYVAPPDHHLLVEPNRDGVQARARLSRGPRENYLRPAIDVLFRSAARYFGPRVAGVLLSGTSNDGLSGLLAVRAAGGVALVQDPADALLPELPQAALAICGADVVATAVGLAPLLTDLVREDSPVEGGPAMPDARESADARIAADLDAQRQGERAGHGSVLSCPDCGGHLWQLDERTLVNFRCHLGHAFYAEVLLRRQSEELEAALWTAVRIFKEKAVLSAQLANRARQENNPQLAARFEEQVRLAERDGELIRQLLTQALGPGTAAQPPALARVPRPAPAVDEPGP
jgi:two-component system chemotaxis response regulator CheB